MTHTKIGRALLTVAAAFVVSPATAAPASAAPTIPSMPDLRNYVAVPVLTDDRGAHFRTTDGLRCTMTAEHVDCVGPVTGTGVDANAISLGRSVSEAGSGYGGSIPGVRLISDGAASSIDTVGDAAPVLRPGQRAVTADTECVVTDGARTSCTIGHPVREWLVVSPTGSGIGPATDGLPSGYPDPVTFVQGHVDSANVRFPSYFTVNGPVGELHCSMSFSSINPPVGCHGDLPGTDANEVYLDSAGTATVIRTAASKFAGPGTYPAPLLPVGYATPYPGGCVAISDGVACYRATKGSNGSQLHGFKVDSTGVNTF